jgi:hypothetical protein
VIVLRIEMALFLMMASSLSAHAQETKLYVPRSPVTEATVQQLSSGEYPGEIRMFGGVKCPTNWLPAEGQELLENQHKALFLAISDLWGSNSAGGNIHKFNLPDMRGVFVRGWNHRRDGSMADPDAAARTLLPGAPYNPQAQGDQVGSQQSDEMLRHHHSTKLVGRWGDKYADYPGWGVDNGSHPHGEFSNPTDDVGGSENRPKNVYV